MVTENEKTESQNVSKANFRDLILLYVDCGCDFTFTRREPSLRERVAKLETWRDEHTRQHNRDDIRRESSINRWFIIIAAIAGALVGALVTKLLCSRII